MDKENAVRPKYETRIDLEREESARIAIENRCKVKLRKLPDRYHADWVCIMDDEIYAIAEFKYRKQTFEAFYSTVILSYDKYLFMKQMAQDIRCRFAFVVQFNTELRRYFFDPRERYYIRYGGRSISPRDEQDEELVVHIPKDLFKEFRSR